MNKVIEWLRDEDTRKLLTSIVMFFMGLGTLLFGFSHSLKSIPVCLTFCIVGAVAVILGAIPLVKRYCEWQGIED